MVRHALLCVLSVAAAAMAHARDQPLRTIVQSSSLAGFQYHAGRALWPLMRTGDRLALYREPWNPYDPLAVRVEWQGAMIGFVPRRENAALARLMDRGVPVEARIVHLQTSRDPWKRVLFEVQLAE